MARKERDYEVTKVAVQTLRHRHSVQREMERRRPRLDGDPAIAIYRAEKAARARRPNLVMLEAKASFARLLADLEQHGKGGRPRKSKGICAAVSSGTHQR